MKRRNKFKGSNTKSLDNFKDLGLDDEIHKLDMQSISEESNENDKFKKSEIEKDRLFVSRTYTLRKTKTRSRKDGYP